MPGLGPWGPTGLNGIAVSPDATRLWVTVSGALPEFPHADGIIDGTPSLWGTCGEPQLGLDVWESATMTTVRKPYVPS